MIKQRLKWSWWGSIGPTAPVAPQHDPELQPRPHLPQCCWPTAPRASSLHGLGFFPRPLPGRQQAPSRLACRQDHRHNCRDTSKMRRRSRPGPSAAGWHDRSVPDTGPSPVPRGSACSSAPPSSAGRTAARDRRDCAAGAVPSSRARADLGAGRLVVRYQVLCSGSIAGSVVATIARMLFSGLYGPTFTSSAHHVSVCPSRKVRSTCTQEPGVAAPCHPAASAASWREPMLSAECHQACEGLRAST